jgi:hypothetical protein
MEYLMEKENASTQMVHLIKETGEIISLMELDMNDTKMDRRLEEILFKGLNKAKEGLFGKMVLLMSAN